MRNNTQGKNKKALLSILLVIIFVVTFFVTIFANNIPKPALAATKNFNSSNANCSGLMSDSDCWNGLPSAGDTININGTAIVDNAFSNLAYGKLRVSRNIAGSSLIWPVGGSNTLNVSTVESGAAGAGTVDMTNGGTLQIRTGWTSTNTAVIPGSGTIHWNTTAANTTFPTALNNLNNLTITATGRVVTLAANTTVAGDLTIAAGTFDVSTSNFALNVGGDFTDNATFTKRSGTVTMNGSSAQVINGSAATSFYNLTIANTSAPVSISKTIGVTGTMTVNSGAIITPNAAVLINSSAAGTITGDGTVQVTRTDATADYSNQYKFTTNTISGLTIEYAGSAAQTVSALTYGGLKINNASGVSLAGNTTVNGLLTLASGNITTGANNIYISSTGDVSQTSGGVVGNLKKYIASGATSKTFEVAGSSYAPLNISFGNVTTPGDLTVSTTNGDHSDIANSGINSSKSVNRYWTLTNSGIAFNTYSATFNYAEGDKDGGADYTKFIVGQKSGTWSLPTVGAKTSTSTQATGLSAFGDFIVGQSVNVAPDDPTLVSPSDGSTINDNTPTLSANYSDYDTGDTGTTNYRIATGSAANCLNNTSIVASGTSSETADNDEDTTWAPASSIGSDGTYYWCAQNNDGVETTSWISMGSFILDTTSPTISFTDNVTAGPVASDTVSASWGDAVVKKWDYDADGVCSTDSGDYSKIDTDSMNQSDETNNGKYICLYAEDAVGNKVTLASANDINIDITAPILAEVTPVATPTNDTTPNYTFSSTEAGTINYGGDCSSTTTTAVVGNNTITFNTLSAGTHSNCTITVKDALNNTSTPLSVSSFTIDLTAPTITFSDNVAAGPVTSDTITGDWGDSVIKKWDYDADGVCSTTAGDYSKTDANSMNQTTEANNGKYICLYGEDVAGNYAIAVSTNDINIDVTGPNLSFTDNVAAGPVQLDTITASWGDALIKKWDYDADGVCSTTAGDYSKTDIDSMNQSSETNNNKYICLYVEDDLGNKSTLASANDINIDITDPTVAEVTPVTTPTNDTTPDYTFSSTEAGTITYGGDCSSATTAATVGNNTITFNTLSAGTHNNCTLYVTDFAGNQSNTINITSFTIDTGAPIISSATSTTPTSSYGPASEINITLNFNESVWSAGLTILLNTGASINTGAITNQTSYSGTYTVGATGSGQNTNELSVSSVTGTITDASENSTVNPTINAGQNINNSKDIKVDTTAPTISSATSTTTNGSYGPTSSINITLNFSEAVDSTGGLEITLNTGKVINTGALSNQTSFSGTYTVGATGSGENTSDLSITSVTGTLVDRTVNNPNSNASPSVPGGSNFNTKDIIVDTTAPVLQNITSSSANGTYGAGDTVNITANYNENIKSVGSSLNITLNNGKTLVLNNVSGSSISATYTVGSIGSGEDILGLDVSAITASTILDDITNPNTQSSTDIPANNNLIDFKTINIDTTNPVVVITAPTKVGTGTISDTTIQVTDNQGILAANITVDASSTVTTSDLVCIQTDSKTVDCTIDIDSSGNLVIKAVDGGGNEITAAENNYLIDNTNSVITITAPTKVKGSSITDTTIQVTDDQGILAANVTVDASTTATTSNFNCTQTNATTVNCTISIDTSGNLVIKAVDGSNNTVTENENGYVIDIIPPEVIITAITKASQSTISNTTIQVTDTDGILATNVVVDPSTTAGTGNFNCTQTDAYTVDCTIDIVSSGDLTIKATDGGGNIDTATETDYLIDNIQPNITITAPTKTKNTSITDTTIHITDDQGILNTNVTVDASSTATTSDLVCTQTDSKTVDCTIDIDSSGTLIIKAVDGANNTRTVSETGYIIEAVNPVITITAPTKISNSEVINTTIHVTDNNGILANSVTVDPSTTVTTNSFNCTQTNATTVDCTIHIVGIGDLSIKAVDKAGNSVITTETGYVVSDEAPVIDFDAPNKYSNAPITNTTINITDAHGISVSDVAIDVSNTVSYNNFNCTQTDINTVDCTIIIISSGNLAITAEDSVNNVSVASENGYIIDMVNPIITITAPTKTAGSVISDTTIHVTDNGAVFTGGISIDAATTVAYNNFSCTQTDSSTIDCTIEITGSGKLVIKAEDGASNQVTAEESDYVIDATPPLIIISAPDKLSASTITTTEVHVTDSMGILADDVSIDASTTAGTSDFICTQTNATTVDCTVNIASSGNLVIKASDSFNNQGTQAENNYIIDNTGPAISITAPTKTSNNAITDTTIHITDDNEVLVENIFVDDTTTIDNYNDFICTQTDIKTVDCTIKLLSSGNLVIEALDLLSNISHQAENGYAINIVLPVVSITAPTKISNTNITNTTIHVTDSGGISAGNVSIDAATTATYSDFVCTQTNANTVDCTITITGSGDLKIKALDSVSGASYDTESGYIIETTPPETTIDSSPALESTSSSATFTFSANESSTFKCKIDSSSYTTCSSPKSYTGLANGSHTFSVYAIDLVGNSDPTPASYTWTIAVVQGGGGGFTPPDTTPPTNTLISINNGADSTSSVNVNLTLGATGASTMMISNSADFTGSVWETFATSKAWVLTIGNGVKTVYAKFKDAAGNISTAVSDSITLEEVIEFEDPEEIFEEPEEEFQPEEDNQPEIEPDQTQSQTYAYEFVSQSPYPSTLNPGQETLVWVEVRNTGTTIWDSNVRLGTGSIYGNPNQQRDYNSEFAASDWLSPNRPTSFVGSLVSAGSTSLSSLQIEPGRTVKVQFTIKAPVNPGVYRAYFTPVADGVTWMNDIGLYWQITVAGENQESIIEPEISNPVVEKPSNIFGDYYIVQPGDSLKSIAQKVYGDSERWRDLVELNKDQYPSLVYNPGNIFSGWVLKYGDIQPIIEVQPEPQPEPEPVIEPQLEPIPGISGDFYIIQPGDSLKSIAQKVYRNSERWRELVELNKNQYPSLVYNPGNIYSGWNLRFQGEVVSEPVVETKPEVILEPIIESEPVFIEPEVEIQIEPQQPEIKVNTPMVESGRFDYYKVIPGDSLRSVAQKLYGDSEKWRRLVELNKDTYNSLYIGGQNTLYTDWLLKYDILVPLLSYNYVIIGQSDYPAEMMAGETVDVWIELKNTGTATWYNSGSNPVRLGTGSAYGNPDQQRDYASEFADEAWISPNRCSALNVPEVKPGEIARFIFTIKAPDTTGTYKAYFTPVVEGLEWMQDRGIYWEIKVKD